MTTKTKLPHNQDCPLISFCIPTNGLKEWLLPTLQSIFQQGVDDQLFEVVVTNNGQEDPALDREMAVLMNQHCNLHYSRNHSFMFLNQLESLKQARGSYLKFVNHRNLFLPGSIGKMISFIESVQKEKPVIYFSNGVLQAKNAIVLPSFDSFVAKLKRYISWTTGVGIWKEHFDAIKDDLRPNPISPHSCILFARRKDQKYIINDLEFSREITSGHANKGTYDLFKAFMVEEPSILLSLYCDGDISSMTLKSVLKDYKQFASELYAEFIIKKRPASYNLTGINDASDIFYSKREIVIGAYLHLAKAPIRRLFRRKKK